MTKKVGHKAQSFADQSGDIDHFEHSNFSLPHE
jgi:hypothetical protein